MSKNLKIAFVGFMFVLIMGALQVHSACAEPIINDPGDGGTGDISSIPEPVTLLLVGTGLAGLALRKRTKK